MTPVKTMGDGADVSGDEPTCQEALAALKVIRQFVSALAGEMSVGVSSYLYRVENIHCKGLPTRQTTVNEFFRKKLPNI